MTSPRHSETGRRRAPGSQPAGFTLIELLCVMAITAVLASLLLPGLARARQMTQKVVCMSNLRHLAVANQLYAQDDRGCFVLAADDIWGKNLHRWHGWRTTTNTVFVPERGPLYPYLGTAGLKACPTFLKGRDYRDQAGQGAGFEAGCGGYGYNQAYVGGRSDLYGVSPDAETHGTRLEDVARASETVMFTDAAYVSGSGTVRTKIAYSFCEPPFWDFGPPTGPSGQRPDPSIDFRHLGHANAAWVDGHVSPHPLAFTVAYQTHSLLTGEEAKTQGVGWFGPESNDLFDLH